MLWIKLGGKSPVMSIDKFLSLFKSKKSQYPTRVRNFITRRIDTAIAELEEKLGLDIDLVLIREKRVIVKVQLIINKKEIIMEKERAAIPADVDDLESPDEDIEEVEEDDPMVAAVFGNYKRAEEKTKEYRRRAKARLKKERQEEQEYYDRKRDPLITRIKQALKEEKLPLWDVNTAKMINQLKQVVTFVSEHRFAFNEKKAEDFLVWTIKQMREIQQILPGVFRVKDVWNPYTIKFILNTNKDTGHLTMTFNKGENLVL